MSEEYLEEIDELAALHEHDLLELFETLTFREKWQKVAMGLKQPPETGAYKWAKLQMLRLLSPAAAVVVPVLIFALIAIFAALAPEVTRSVEVQMIEPEPYEDLDDIEPPPIEDPIDMPDVDVEFTQNDPVIDQPDVTRPNETDFSPQPVEFDAVAMVKSPVIMKGIYGSRNSGARGEAMARFGGMGTESSVLRALRWLKKNQGADGAWSPNKPAMTSLALLAYLAHGDTPASEEFGSTVEGAIRFLVNAQKGDGHFTGKDGHDYTQPIAAYALSEAFAITKVPQLKEAAMKATGVVIDGQNPTGGFNYNLIPVNDRDDTSYIAWCVQALKAAKMAELDRDLPKFKDCWKKAIKGIKKNYLERDGYGGFGYTSPGKTGLSGAGVLCLQFLGRSRDDECKGGVRGLKEVPVKWGNLKAPWQKSPVYYWYYITQAKFHAGGSTWKSWNREFAPLLKKNQNVVPKNASGYVDHKGQSQEIGSWISPGEHEHGPGEIMDTILCCLMLEVYYRYLPTFMPVKHEDEEGELGDDDEDLEIDIV